MIVTFGILSLSLAAFGWWASAALIARPRLALAAIAVAALVFLVSPAVAWLAGLPGDAVSRVFANANAVEAIAIVLCLEAILGAALLCCSTSVHPFPRRSLRRFPRRFPRRFVWAGLLLVPLPSVVAAPLLAAYFSMVHGPRIALETLAWTGFGAYLAAAAVAYWLASLLKRAAPDFLLELLLLLRFTVGVGAAAMVASLHHRPAPTLEFEPFGLLIAVAVCGLLITYGYLRKSTAQ